MMGCVTSSHQLVAIDQPGGPEFVGSLRAVWDRGDAAFPVDQRLPEPARARLLDAMAPGRILGPGGEERRRRGGRPVDEGDALVVATSGSTGEAKGVVLTHDAVRASALATSSRLAVTPADRWLACLPLSHVGGLGVVTRALVTDTPLTVLRGFDADAVSAAAHAGATLVSLVATTLARVDPTLFRTIVLGGATPPAGLPANVVVTYGSTETGSGVVYDGRPLDGVDVALGIDGEIRVRGPMLLRAYRDGTCPLDADGWYATGDLGEWSDDGRLVVRGRRGDLIITGGENVWPEPVERVLREHPGIADVAVLGAPDAEWGHVVVAAVVPADRDRPPTLAELRAVVSGVLPTYCAPRRLALVARIPRSPLGKPLRPQLAKAVSSS
jgi:o-succinylbenzoate---CoA ligase